MMISSGINLVMTVIGFGVSTMFIVFVFTRLICARIQLSASRRYVYVASRADLSVLRILFVRRNSSDDLAAYAFIIAFTSRAFSFGKYSKVVCKYWIQPFQLERGLQGIESAMVASFPTKKYTEDLFSSPEDAQCAVCLSEYNLEDVLHMLPNCDHSFHASCVDLWLHQHTTCLVCRISLRDISDKSLVVQPLFSSALRSCHVTDPWSLESHPHSTEDECETTAPEGFLGMDRDALPSKDSGCKHVAECPVNRQLTQTSSSMIPKDPQ